MTDRRARDRALLVATYWRTNLTMRQIAALFGVSKSAAARIIDHLGPMLALQPRKRFGKDTVLIVDGTLVPAHKSTTTAARSGNCRLSTSRQVVIDADTRLVIVVGRPPAGHRNDCNASAESGAEASVGTTMATADGGCPGTGFVLPHRLRQGGGLPDPKQTRHTSCMQAPTRVFHALARFKTWKILRDCRLHDEGVHHAMLGIALMHNLAIAG